LVVSSAHHALAQAAIAPPFNNYAAKFTCGTAAVDDGDVKGTYATSINIHNPEATVAVPFFKKIVVANQEGQGFNKPIIKQDSLPPDAVEYVDCTLIYRLTTIAPGTHIDGFVVLEVPPVANPAGAKVQPTLDVIGKYSARTGATGFSVVNYPPTHITF
jgi:hypothetical protein